MAFVYKQLASSLSGKTFTSTHHNLMDVGELTHTKFNILARKMTKMIFGMGVSYDEKVYVLEMIMKNIVIEIANRSPKILYKRKNKHVANSKKIEIDVPFFIESIRRLKN